MDWRSPSLQSTPDWKIRSQSPAVTPEKPTTQPLQQQQPKPGIVRALSLLGSPVPSHNQMAQQASPVALMATPREVKVVLGNKAIMGDEGVPISKPVDDYMRDMEVGLGALLPLRCASCLL